MPAPAVLRSLRLDHARAGRGIAATLAGVVAAAWLVLAAHPAAANPAGPGDPSGRVDRVSSPAAGQLAVSGWAVDPDNKTSPITVLGLVDGNLVTSTVTKLARPDVALRIHSGPTAGFALTVPYPPTGVHTVCIAARNIAAGVDTVLRCVPTPLGTALTPAQTATHNPSGHIDTAYATPSTVRVGGWAFDPDDRLRPVTVVVYVDGESAATLPTSLARPDTVRLRQTGPRAGFAAIVAVRPGAHLACVWTVNVGLGSNRHLGCRSVDTRGPAGSGAVPAPTVNTKVVTEASRHIGQPYVWGATGPKAFDCSGLVQYSYRLAGISTPRIAADQFTAARLIPAARAVRGDLVFYHDSVGYVYHVGIYAGPGMTIAAVDPAEGIRRQAVWDPTATYGSFTHN